MINFIKELPSYLNRKIKTKKTSYSLTSIDLVIDFIFKKNGVYIDDVTTLCIIIIHIY